MNDFTPIETIKKYPKKTKISDLKVSIRSFQITLKLYSDFPKEKLYMICGVEPSNMELKAFNKIGMIEIKMEDDKELKEYFTKETESPWQVHILVKSQDKVRYIFDKNEEVKKYEISEEDYAKRENSFRKFKEKYLQKPNEPPKTEIKQEDPTEIPQIGNRCKVKATGTVGTVRYVGKTHFAPGIWVGVMLDEPVGKNNGSVKDRRYFECPDKYGIFVLHDKIEVGEFKEESLFSDEEEEF